MREKTPSFHLLCILIKKLKWQPYPKTKENTTGLIRQDYVPDWPFTPRLKTAFYGEPDPLTLVRTAGRMTPNGINQNGVRDIGTATLIAVDLRHDHIHSNAA